MINEGIMSKMSCIKCGNYISGWKHCLWKVCKKI